MKKPKVIKIFGHYKLINENGEILWSENNMDGHNISQQRKLLETIDIIMPPYIEIDLKKMRKDKNLTLREVAKKIGISYSHINKIETGKIEKPGYDIVVSLYNFYKNI